MTSVKPIPKGYHTVTPYILVQGADKLIDFVKRAFDARETERYSTPDGTIGHAEVRIGDSSEQEIQIKEIIRQNMDHIKTFQEVKAEDLSKEEIIKRMDDALKHQKQDQH